VTDHIQWIILGIFALLFLLLSQSRELMRQIGRTAEEWHRMRAAFKQPRDKKAANERGDEPQPGEHDLTQT
jgi:Sec-independent protein translocase protein TatA